MSIASWPMTRSVSGEYSVLDGDPIEPTFEEPKHFHRTTTKGVWYCTMCAPLTERRLHTFNATVAMNHEKTKNHKDNVIRMTTWQPVTTNTWGVPMNDWGIPKEPFEMLQESDLSQVLPLQKRVKRWIRDMAKAEGLEVDDDDEDLDDDQRNLTWDQQVTRDYWNQPAEDWTVPVDPPPQPPEEIERDPRAFADFKFVEKVARKRGMRDDRRRLHAFYRLPTDEKISRIQEIVQFIHSH